MEKEAPVKELRIHLQFWQERERRAYLLMTLQE
jgi:hypothetical protein